jgi:hypothetical protein
MGHHFGMLAWMKRRRSTAHNRPEPVADAPRQRSVMSGKYLSLYEYLENRYANTVVLTFAEIEDLLGFPLPDLARRREDWWTKPDPHTARPSYSDSWILASRTARPNLRALTVVFDRAC